ncbi:MAG TPA: YncE family protein, partial [Actinomycetes bacterium]|nr:YncE family protein [Actinomycetes bacterium]
MKLITVDQGPTGLAVNSTGSRIYTANFPSSTVSVIDTATDTVIRSPITFGPLPFGVVVTPDERRVYVGNSGSNTVSVIDTNGAVALSDHPVRLPPLGHLNRAYCGHDRVFQVVSWCLLVGRASTPPGLADAVGLNATV